jgi:4-amino-4-deoxy-L-arabinose transferase-like glycosyltransferase
MPPQSQITKKTEPSHTATALGLALLLRLFGCSYALLHNAHGWFFSRGTEMGLMAQSIVTGHGLASPFGGDTGPTAMFAPLYPLLVAAVFRVCGVYTTASAIALIAINIIADLATIWLMMFVARRFFDQRAALIAGLIWTLSPTLWFLPTIFWDTSITVCLLTGLIAFALLLQESPGRSAWLAFGAYCGMTALVNPALLLTLLGVVAATMLVLSHRRKLGWMDVALSATLFLLVFCAWPIRNAEVFHAFVPLRTAVGLDVWMGNHEGATGYLDEKLFPTFNPAELASYNQQGEIAYTHAKMKSAESWMIQNPAHFLELTARRFVCFWLGSGTRGGPAVFWLHAGFTTALGLIGWWFVLRRRSRELALLFAMPLLLFPLPYYISHAEFRFRIVIDPLLSVLTAYALVEWFERPKPSPDAPSWL